MFGVKHNECVGFESRWQVKKVSSEGTSQTTGYSTDEKSSNTPELCTIETQTEPAENSTDASDADMDKLAEWLRKIYPQVHKELDKSAKSRVFRGYRLQEDSEEVEGKLLQIFNVCLSPDSGDYAKKLSLISWNATGKTLAVSCNFEHKSWCHHTGHILIYGLSSFEKIADIPKKKLTTDTCVTSLKFHPFNPAVLAASNFAGQIFVWNIQSDTDIEAIIKINAHTEYITLISWTDDIDDARNALLASSSIDTYLKLWTLDVNSKNSKLVARYKIKPPVLGAGLKTSESQQNKVDRAVTCFDFSKHIPDIFVVALEGGLLVHCSLLGTSDLKGSTKDEPLLDPVFKYFEPHGCEITSVKFSPNRKDMFLSCGTDTEVRVYLTEQEEPAQVMFIKNPFNDIMWVLHEEKLLAGCGKDGNIQIFNVTTGNVVEVISNDKIEKNALACISSNNKKPSLVAVGDIHGHLQLWNVPWHIYSRK